MMGDVISVTLSFEPCKALSKAKGKGAHQLLALLAAAGTRFVGLNDKRELDFHPDPITDLNEDGNFLLSPEVAHRLLGRSPLDTEVMRKFGPTGNLSYLRTLGAFGVSQSGLSDEPQTLDRLGKGQVSLGHKLYPALRPLFGHVDRFGVNRLSEKSLKKRELKYLFWANFYGPAYVAKYGRKFFMEAPGWKKEQLDDGGVLYVVTRSYYKWFTKPSQDAVKYFQTKVPGIKAYRARQGHW
jgi:hypothetical protein